METISIPCRGGLNLSNNNHEMLSKPGEAIDLVNFECSKEGGYRRINGYEPVTAPLPETGHIKGVINYKGILSARGDNLYHTSDNGATWDLVNRDMSGVSKANLTAQPILPRENTVRYMFSPHFYNNTQYVYMTDGANNPAVFSIDPTGNYRFAEITADSAPDFPLKGAKYCTFYKNQLILGGMTDSPTSIFYSSFANSDLINPEDSDKETPQENFNGATSGSIDFGDIITGMMTHRDILYVFCKSSIFKVVGLDQGPSVANSQPVTRDIGCVDGFTIQEIGGDLLFLAPDGLRTIAKTERLDDIELGVVSRKIDDVLNLRLTQADRYLFVSTVVRQKNQYRLWFADLQNNIASIRGVIAAYTYNPENKQYEWGFSETQGLGVTAVDNGYDGQTERIIFGNQNEDEIMQQEKGFTFNGTTIDYRCQLAFSDYGDISIRKCIHKVFLNSRAEGNVEAGLEVRYDYNVADASQPFIYEFDRMTLAAEFGKPKSTFGDPILLFGASTYGDTSVYTEGSGFVVSLRIRPLKTIQDASFDLQSFQIDLTSGGKI